jgi:hypothetical protein
MLGLGGGLFLGMPMMGNVDGCSSGKIYLKEGTIQQDIRVG